MTSSPHDSTKWNQAFDLVTVTCRWVFVVGLVIWGSDLIWNIACLPQLRRTQVRKLSITEIGNGTPTVAFGSDGEGERNGDEN